MNFSDWLLLQLNGRNWSQSDLARASGLTRSAISYYIGAKSKKPDEEALQKIAHALQLPPETVYRAAGILPPSAENPDHAEVQHILTQLDPQRQTLAKSILRTLLEDQAREQEQKRPAPKPRHAT